MNKQTRAEARQACAVRMANVLNDAKDAVNAAKAKFGLLKRRLQIAR